MKGLPPRCGRKQRSDRWTEIEIGMLRELSEKGLRPCEMAAFFPHRTGADTIRAQLRKHGIATNGQTNPPAWTKDEDAILRGHWLAGARMADIVEALPARSRFSIASRRLRLGLTMDMRKRAAIDGAQLDPDEWPSDDPIGTVNLRPAQRTCLGCGMKFESQGPHNRRCGPCRAADGSGGNSDDGYRIAAGGSLPVAGVRA